MESDMVGEIGPSGEWLKNWSTGQTREHLEAIGQIIVFGGMIDGAVCMLLWHYGQMDPAVGRCVTSELKTPQMMGMVRRIAEARNLAPETISDLTALKKELDEIGEFRNRIAHGEWGGDTLSRHFTAKSLPTQPPKIITVDELRTLSDRFMNAYLKLIRHLIPKELRDILPAQTASTSRAP